MPKKYIFAAKNQCQLEGTIRLPNRQFEAHSRTASCESNRKIGKFFSLFERSARTHFYAALLEIEVFPRAASVGKGMQQLPMSVGA